MYNIKIYLNNYSYILYKLFLSFLSVIFLSGWSYAETEQILTLNPGLNHVSIKVLNNSNIDVKSIKIIIDDEELPEGFTITKELQQLDVLANSKTKVGLKLKIDIDEKAKQGFYKLPFVLRDKANHSWSYDLYLKLETQKPSEFRLLPNHPNPFNAETHIKYELANVSLQPTQLVIIDVTGKRIRTLVDKKQSAGTYNMIWDGKDETGAPVSSGFYFYKITSGPFVMVRKMMLLK